MVRRFACILLVVAAGCDGEIDQGEDVPNLSPQEQLARTAWIKLALPALSLSTTPACNTCHETGEQGAPKYLDGTDDLDRRETMIAITPSVVNLTSPKTSPVLLKGMHEGPPLPADAVSNLLTWITYERGARGGSMFITSDKVPVADCQVGNPDDAACMTTTIDLSSAGSPGSSITFKGNFLSGDLLVQKLSVVAGSSGLKMVHPIFFSYPAAGSNMDTGTPDANDTFYNINLDLAAGTTQTLTASGIATFAGFTQGDPVGVQFDALSTK